jgi:hypothetical protein
MLFTIPVVYEMYGTISVEADTLDQAIEIALAPETALPDNSTYVDETMRVDEESIGFLNE